MPVALVFGPDRRWRLSCAESLRTAGYQVRLASTPAELMKALAATSDALLIIDTAVSLGVERPGSRPWVRTPGESGTQTAGRVLADVSKDYPTSSA